MPCINVVHMISVLVVGSLAVAGCGPESGTMAPSAKIAMAGSDTNEAGAATRAEGCQDVQSRQGRDMRWFATATPADIRRCLAVKCVGICSKSQQTPLQGSEPHLPGR